MKSSVMIYPYNENYEPIIKHQSLLSNIEIKSIVYPESWNNIEKNSSLINETNLVASTDFSKMLKECDMIWFAEDAKLILPNDLLYKRLDEAISSRKKVLYTRYKNYNDLKKIKTIYSGKIIFIDKLKQKKEFKKKYCQDLKTPTICICGTDEYTDKYEIQLSVREELIKRGYKVTSVSSRLDSEILGIHSFPEFMLNDKIGSENKILKFNSFLKQLEVTESPEIFIVGIPGGIIPFDKYNYNHFGILHYEISKAVNFDYSIACIPYYKEFTHACFKIKKEIYDRFRINIDFFHMAPIAQDITLETGDHLRDFLTLDENFIEVKLEENKSNNTNNIYNLRKKEKINDLVTKIIDKLSSN